MLSRVSFVCYTLVAVVYTKRPAMQEAVAAAVAHDICGSLLVVDETLLDGIAKAALGSPLDPPDSPGNLFLGYWRGKAHAVFPAPLGFCESLPALLLSRQSPPCS